MTPLDARPLLARFESVLARHALGAPGRYARWTLPGRDASREVGPNPYGSADAANLLYTLGRFPRQPAERAAWVDALRDFQAPVTGSERASGGLFHEPTHHPLHTTAHCLGALELFDAGPRHPLAALAPLAADPAATEAFLDGLDWTGAPWQESHRGAGLYAALVLADAVDAAWVERFFAWLARECDAATGLWRAGCVPRPEGLDLRFPHLAGSFHYLFCLEHGRRAHPFPSALVDTCLELRATRAFPFASSVGFAELDWIYCLHRAARQSGHRLSEARQALRELGCAYLEFLTSLDPDTDPGLDDLHALLGAACALAELQAALPGEVRSDRPLRLVLDRRPFV